MFLNHFKLAEQPFGATPDPRFLFPTHSHREALASLQCSYLSNRGFAVLIAEPGMGKTTLLNEFLRQLHGRARTVFLFNTLTEPAEVVANILSDLGVVPGSTQIERNRQLNEILASEARAGRRLILIIDEAQNLSHRVLEAVRQLTNFETASSKLMQVVLAGQPQLADKLASPQAKQLRQRISTICQLTPLSLADTTAYISHRLRVSGWKKGNLFAPSAIRLIAEASCGIPRNINTLCFNSLCLCYARNATLVERSMVEEAAADLKLSGDNTEAVLSARCPSSPQQKGSSKRLRQYFSVWKTVAYSASLMLVVLAVLAGVVSHETNVDARQNLPAQVAERNVTRPVATKDTEHAAASVGEMTKPIEITIQAGDTLESVARTHLGTFSESLLKQIRMLNPSITNPDHIESGRTIRLPGNEQSIAGTPKR